MTCPRVQKSVVIYRDNAKVGQRKYKEYETIYIYRLVEILGSLDDDESTWPRSFCCFFFARFKRYFSEYFFHTPHNILIQDKKEEK